MPRQTVFAEQDKAAHWITQAECYEKEAEKRLKANSLSGYNYYRDKAIAAREKAATYTTTPA